MWRYVDSRLRFRRLPDIDRDQTDDGCEPTIGDYADVSFWPNSAKSVISALRRLRR
jgi:hypothetical protein